MIIQKIVEFFAPAECLGCGLRGNFICKTCVKTVDKLPRRCFVCREKNNDGAVCERCRIKTPLSSLAVAADYEGLVREATLTLKNKRARSVAEPLGDLIAGAVAREIAAAGGATGAAAGSAVDLVSWAPVSPARRRERGYNQAELLGRRVARRIRLPAAEALGRVNSPHQTGAPRAQRLTQVAGAFYATRRLDGLRVLLVDDVATTAATLEECARVLLAAGAAEVHAAVVARSQN
jgi:ComF family protein